MKAAGTPAAPLRAPVIEVVAISACLCLFSLCVNHRSGLHWVSIGALFAAAAVMARALPAFSAIPAAFGFLSFSRRTAVWSFSGLGIGLLAGTSFRYLGHASLLPHALGAFVLTAAAIGVAEELVYRGFIQGRLSPAGSLWAVTGSTVAHSAYKCCLFAGLFLTGQTPVLPFVLWTIGGSLTCALLRDRSGHILPSLIAHALFDVIVYGNRMSAPWWVWG